MESVDSRGGGAVYPAESTEGTRPLSGDRQFDRKIPDEFPRVVVFDDSVRRALYERWLPDAVEVSCPASFEEARSVVDDSVAVALVRHEFPEQKRAAIRDLLDAQGPHCRTVLTTTGRSPVADGVLDEEECLHGAFNEEKFCDVVCRQLRMATYRAVLEWYYECTTQLTSLEVKLDEKTLADDDHYRWLSELADGLKEQLDSLQAGLGPEAVRTLLSEIVPPEFERRAHERPSPDSKYRPDHCHKCGRDWNRNPDGSRAGYRRLGALVWKCTDCGIVYDRSDPTNNQIDRYG